MNCKELENTETLNLIAWKDRKTLTQHIHIAVPDRVLIESRMFGFDGIDFETEGILSQRLQSLAHVVARMEEYQRDQLAKTTVGCPKCENKLYLSILPEEVSKKMVGDPKELLQCRTCGHYKYR